MVRLVKACLVTACLGLAVPVSFVWLSYGVLRLCEAVMLRSGPLIWVMASCGQVSRSSLGKVRPGRLSYGVLGLGGFVAARFG
jgi:hypothetical protein